MRSGLATSICGMHASKMSSIGLLLLVPTDVVRGYHLSFVENCKYSVDIAECLVNYPIGSAKYLSDALPFRRRIEVAFSWDNRSYVGVGAQRLHGIPDLDVPTLRVLL